MGFYFPIIIKCPLYIFYLSKNTHLYLSPQVQETLSFLVTIKDRVALGGQIDSEDDNLVQVPISVIVLDENDNAPEFQNVRTYSILYTMYISQLRCVASKNHKIKEEHKSCAPELCHNDTFVQHLFFLVALVTNPCFRPTF